MLKEFISYYKPHKKLFVLDMIAAFIVALCDLFYPMITRQIINDIIPNGKIRLLFLLGDIFINYIYNEIFF